MGITEGGHELTLNTSMEVLAETDAFGQSAIDGVWRGGECTHDFVSMAYKAGSLAAFWPYGGTLAGNGVLGILINPGASNVPIGILATDLAKAVVLTAVAGTPAAATPATITATKALLKDNYPAKLLFSSKLRKVPVSLRYWPYDAGSSVIRFFATT